jgi:fatty-acyl-CoA synthase
LCVRLWGCAGARHWFIRSLAPELAHCPPGALRAARLPHLTTVIHFADTDEPGVYNFAVIKDLGGRIEHARLDELSRLIQPDDPVNIQFTSGTTGSPKAATLTHHGLLNNGYFFGVTVGAVEGDRCCATLPLYNVGAMVLSSIWASHSAKRSFIWGKLSTRSRPLKPFRRKNATGSAVCRRC